MEPRAGGLGLKVGGDLGRVGESGVGKVKTTVLKHQ